MLSSNKSKNMFAVFREEDSADEVEQKKDRKPKQSGNSKNKFAVSREADSSDEEEQKKPKKSGNSKNQFAVFIEADSADELEQKKENKPKENKPKEKKPKKIKVKKEIPEPTNSGSIFSKINNPKKNKKNLPVQAEIIQPQEKTQTPKSKPQEKTSTQTADEHRAMKKKKKNTKSTKMSILTRACLLVAHLVLTTVTRNVVVEHFAKYDMLHKVVWQTQVLYFTVWNLHLIS